MILEGKVIKGIGKAKVFVNMMKDIFYQKTNIELFPGTLNVELNKSYDLKPTYIIKAEEYGGKYNVQVQECTLLGNKAYIVRSEKNLQKEGDYDKNIIEIVSDINFRKKYNLNDGKTLEISIVEKNAILEKISENSK